MVGLSEATKRLVVRKPLPPLSYGRLVQAADLLGDAGLLRPERTVTTYLPGDDGEPVPARVAFYRLHNASFQGSLHFSLAADHGELAIGCVTQAWVGALLGNVRHMAVGVLEMAGNRLDEASAGAWLARWQEHFTEEGRWTLAPAEPAAGWLNPLCSLALAERGIALTEARVAVVGPQARATAIALHDAGARVVGVGDVTGGVYSERGLPGTDLAALARQLHWGSIRHGAAIQPEELASLPCDLLIWGDRTMPLTRGLADGVQAPVLIEALPAAVLPEADAVLAAKQCLVVPDLLALAAARTSGTENGPLWLMAAYDDVRRQAEGNGSDRRLAAYTLAARRASAGQGRRGTQPLG